jgi:hypothetical protein
MRSQEDGVILSLCDFSGSWSEPYSEAGYEVITVDLQRGEDIRSLRFLSGRRVHGILAAPPCTHFASSGARWWSGKGDQAVIDGMSVVDACLRAVAVYDPDWWALENPVGRLRDYIGPPVFTFNPCDYGDPWTKKTCLWGFFVPPTPMFSPSATRVAPTLGSIVRDKMSSKDKNGRSETPPGFARAFFEANP